MPAKEQTKMLNTRLENSFFIEFKTACDNRGMTASEAVRDALKLWMNEGGAPTDAMEELRALLNSDRAMNAAWAVLKRGGQE